MNRLMPVVIALIAIGLAYRLWPVLAGMPALANFFVTEDGYLMLTVARNMAIGNGMSVSDGTIPTNGVQPLIAFLFTLPYVATGGDKITSLIGVHVIHTAIALAAVFAIHAFARRLLAPRDTAAIWPWSVALIWFLGPLLVRHSMNGLETGLYTLTIVLALLLFARLLDQGAAASTGLRLGFGAFCGLVVLARNDGVFFVAAAFLVWAVIEVFVHRAGLVAMFARLVPPGLVSIAVAAPWLINNQIRFGSIVPISGTAQSHDATFAQNLSLVPVTLFELLFPMLPVPGGVERIPSVIALAGAAIVVVLACFLWRVLRHGSFVTRALVGVYLIYGTALVSYYGLFFGAPHFLARYLAPLAPLLIAATLIATLEIGRLLVRARPDALAWAYTGVGLILILGLLTRALFPGVTKQGHEQVIAWTKANVAEDVWVGAIQTGTLGYWHDQTYNLDGKVNPVALTTIRTDGHVLNYVTQSPIEYVIDWAGIGEWTDSDFAQEGFADAFERVLKDDAANLAVIKRK